MKVSEQEAQRLLAQVEGASSSMRSIQAETQERLAAAKAERMAAIEAAMDAGIPRKLIAERAGVALNRLYAMLAEYHNG